MNAPKDFKKSDFYILSLVILSWLLLLAAKEMFNLQFNQTLWQLFWLFSAYIFIAFLWIAYKSWSHRSKYERLVGLLFPFWLFLLPLAGGVITIQLSGFLNILFRVIIVIVSVLYVIFSTLAIRDRKQKNRKDKPKE